MPSLLGKRKSPSTDDSDGSQEQLDAQELLRRHFEAHFKPLAIPGLANTTAKKTSGKASNTKNGHDASDSESSQDESDSHGDAETDQSDSEWSGVSDDEGMLGFVFLPPAIVREESMLTSG
jgi:hypothetical protein